MSRPYLAIFIVIMSVVCGYLCKTPSQSAANAAIFVVLAMLNLLVAEEEASDG